MAIFGGMIKLKNWSYHPFLVYIINEILGPTVCSYYCFDDQDKSEGNSYSLLMTFWLHRDLVASKNDVPFLVGRSVGPSPLAVSALTSGFCMTAPAQMFG